MTKMYIYIYRSRKIRSSGRNNHDSMIIIISFSPVYILIFV